MLDVDNLHGNGTQQLFYDRADVAYASLHADPARMYPYLSAPTDPSWSAWAWTRAQLPRSRTDIAAGLLSLVGQGPVVPL